MNADSVILQLFEEAFEQKTWHGPNLWQSLKGITAKQAAWRPAPRRHNIWEEALHAAYWKYAVRRRLQGGQRGSFVIEGSNFFPRPQPGKLTEAAWKADKAILRQEHEALRRGKTKRDLTALSPQNVTQDVGSRSCAKPAKYRSVPPIPGTCGWQRLQPLRLRNSLQHFPWRFPQWRLPESPRHGKWPPADQALAATHNWPSKAY